MRQVDRNLVNAPNNLSNLSAIQLGHLSNHKNIRQDIYAHDDVKQALKALYHDKCYICECYVGDSYDVEHFLPKKHFPNLGYTWENLHKVCTPCNLAKESNQFLVKDTSGNVTDILLLDPSSPSYSIHDYLSFNINGETVLVNKGTDSTLKHKADITAKYLNGELKKTQGKPFEHASKLNHLRSSRIAAFERSLRENRFMSFQQNIMNIHLTLSNYMVKTNLLEIQHDRETYDFLAKIFESFLNEHCPFCSVIREYCFVAFKLSFNDLKAVSECLRLSYGLPIY
ncbi:TIGR02646 family protein [Acinetobacter sp. ANC 3789]|uniref:hypothetical protein n=1 Tax=Acinetobacter sp. ANC 3789 TaxID=1217714 RepID=UPI0002CE1C4D|nr:hypothetical protein [Acinetobacter sp. ANC 3789]ENU80280.1 TIGR02646 family protein [Acinetobacter sp. ANC 3789]